MVFLKDKPLYSRQLLSMLDWSLSSFTVHVNHNFFFFFISLGPVIPLKMDFLLFGSKCVILLFMDVFQVWTSDFAGDKTVGRDGL